MAVSSLASRCDYPSWFWGLRREVTKKLYTNYIPIITIISIQPPFLIFTDAKMTGRIQSSKPTAKSAKPNWENRVPHFGFGPKPLAEWEGPKPK